MTAAVDHEVLKHVQTALQTADADLRDINKKVGSPET